MREIKFRQRIKGMHGVKDYWHYWGDIDGEFIAPKYEVEWDERISYQYIGIKDTINKKEIYEGDIVRAYESTGDEYNTVHEIRYFADSSDYPAFDIFPTIDTDCNGISYLVAGEGEIEVIGNTCENPDSLENIKKQKR